MDGLEVLAAVRDAVMFSTISDMDIIRSCTALSMSILDAEGEAALKGVAALRDLLRGASAFCAYWIDTDLRQGLYELQLQDCRPGRTEGAFKDAIRSGAFAFLHALKFQVTEVPSLSKSHCYLALYLLAG